MKLIKVNLIFAVLYVFDNGLKMKTLTEKFEKDLQVASSN